MAKDTKADPGVASDAQNAKLEHSRGGMTTRDDPHDLGVPMLPGDPSERQGPEDALGEGPKRGDYRERIGPESYQPHEMRANPDFDSTEDVDADGNASKPATVAQAQRPRAEDIGDEKGKKGGVETDPLYSGA